MAVWGLLAAAFCLIGLAGLPASVCDRYQPVLRHLLPVWMLALGIAAAIAAVSLMFESAYDLILVDLPYGFGFGVYFDHLTAVIVLMISWIGWAILRFSNRYLEGNPRQGQFLRWVGFTIGCVTLVVISRNLVMLSLAWLATSWGLNRLLLFFPERSWAIWAARKKFLISRIGDSFLVTALVLILLEFETVAFSDLFSKLESVSEGGEWIGTDLFGWIGVMLVLGAITKSAQLPFHSWLPDTMETPTPVSALMHAGIVNAGGFLVIRLSGLVSLSPLAMDLMLAIGGSTALVGSITMVTQSSIKRSLAWSTIAQMGFMMLQCGLGAFTAATLHIVAHSFYKAHAFLISGSAIDSGPGVRAALNPLADQDCRQGSIWVVLSGGAIGLAMLVGVGWMVTFSFGLSEQSFLFGMVLALAFSQLLLPTMGFRSWRVTVTTVTIMTLACIGYWLSHLAMEAWLADSVATKRVAWGGLQWALTGFIAFVFCLIFGLQSASPYLMRYRWCQALYVHAAHGFYLDIPARRLTAKLWKVSSACP